MKNAMSPRRRIAVVTIVCSIVTAAAGLIPAVRSVRPSRGKPYERLTVEEAATYMSYEEMYTLVDVRQPEDFQNGHLEDAVNIPYDRLVRDAALSLKDQGETIYVYGKDEEESCYAAQKLSDMGYTGVAEIGSYSDWEHMTHETETEGLMVSEIE